jgi:hypothetical protein
MKKKSFVPVCWPLVQVTVLRPRSRQRYGSLFEALESFRPWVVFGESIRIFDRTFGL